MITHSILFKYTLPTGVNLCVSKSESMLERKFFFSDTVGDCVHIYDQRDDENTNIYTSNDHNDPSNTMQL